MSLSPLHNTGGEGAQRERDLLRRLLASMTQAESAIKPCRETCRHTQCRLSYCLRERKGTKEQYCRFAEGLQVRGFGAPNLDLDYAENKNGASSKPKEAVPNSDPPSIKAPTHYYAEDASAKDGTALLRWRIYVGKAPLESGLGGEDPKINSCCPSHARVFRSNCDAKPCVDKYGVAMYVTKTANYIAKPEVKSEQYANLARVKLVSAAPGAKADAPLRSFLFDVCKRDYSSQEIGASAGTTSCHQVGSVVVPPFTPTSLDFVVGTVAALSAVALAISAVFWTWASVVAFIAEYLDLEYLEYLELNGQHIGDLSAELLGASSPLGAM
jgi:hypothetical protein